MESASQASLRNRPINAARPITAGRVYRVLGRMLVYLLLAGANEWKRFLHITLPLLMPTMAFVVIVTTLSSFLAFTEVYVMTVETGGGRGGPNFATNLMAFHIFNTAIAYGHEGYGSAMAAIFFIIMVMVGYLQYRFIRASYDY